MCYSAFYFFVSDLSRGNNYLFHQVFVKIKSNTVCESALQTIYKCLLLFPFLLLWLI